MYSETHSLMDGKVHVYKRGRSRYWQCATYMHGRNHRKSTKHESLALAMDFAREWYMAVYVDNMRMQQSSHAQALIDKASSLQQTEPPAPSLHRPAPLHRAGRFNLPAIRLQRPQKSLSLNIASLPKGSGMNDGRKIMCAA